MSKTTIGNYDTYGCTWVRCFDLSNQELDIAYNDLSYTVNLAGNRMDHDGLLVGKETTEGIHLTILHEDGKFREFREYAIKLYFETIDPKSILLGLENTLQRGIRIGRDKMQ